MKKGQGKRLLIGVIAVFALFQVVANSLGSVRGEFGVLVGLIVIAATVVTEKLLFGKSYVQAATDIGLGKPNLGGTVIAIGVSVVLIGSVFAFASLTGTKFEFYDRWPMLVPGLFFQAGIAEETLFRGYLFGHLRQRTTFWKAASFAAIPFVLVHLILFYSLPWSLAGASILLSVAMSFPLSELFEQSGDTIWGPAIVHFATQAVVKLLIPTGDAAWLFPFFWIAVCAIVPLIVYAVPAIVRLVLRIPMRPVVTVLMTLFSLMNSATGQEPVATSSSLLTREELTSDWNGARTKLRAKGVDLKFRLTQYYQGVTGEGGNYAGKLDSQIRFDLEKLAHWKGLSLQVKTETRFGRTPSAGNVLPINTGVITPASSGNAFSVTALNITQLVPLKNKGDLIAIGAGKYSSLDSSREPFTSGAGITRFMNVAANGNPAVGLTVPAVTNGATVAWIRKGSPLVTFAVFDPVASPNSPGIKRLFRDGATFVPGISIPTRIADRSGRNSLSATITTRKLTPFDQIALIILPGPPTKPVVPRGGSWSLTYTFHQYLRERTFEDGRKVGWGIFGTFTAADKTTNPASGFMNIGVGGGGPFRSRPRDQFGIAYGLTNVSTKLKDALGPLLRLQNERIVEAFYNYSVTPWLTLSADLQVLRPARVSADSAVAPSARMVVQF